MTIDKNVVLPIAFILLLIIAPSMGAVLAKHSDTSKKSDSSPPSSSNSSPDASGGNGASSQQAPIQPETQTPSTTTDQQQTLPALNSVQCFDGSLVATANDCRQPPSDSGGSSSGGSSGGSSSGSGSKGSSSNSGSSSDTGTAGDSSLTDTGITGLMPTTTSIPAKLSACNLTNSTLAPNINNSTQIRVLGHTSINHAKVADMGPAVYRCSMYLGSTPANFQFSNGSTPITSKITSGKSIINSFGLPQPVIMLSNSSTPIHSSSKKLPECSTITTGSCRDSGDSPQQTSAYASGFSHGVADGKLALKGNMHWYILQVGKGFTFHTQQFNTGYTDGFCKVNPMGGSDGDDQGNNAFSCN